MTQGALFKDRQQYGSDANEHPPGEPKDFWTLAQVRAWMREQTKKGKPFNCLICKQRVKVYKRPLNASMAKVLIVLARHTKEGEYVHLPTFLLRHGLQPTLYGDTTKLLHWGILDHHDGALDDGNPNAGMWRVSDKGRQFVRGEIAVPKYVRIYNKIVLGFSKEETDIKAALKNKHDYRSLMRG